MELEYVEKQIIRFLANQILSKLYLPKNKLSKILDKKFLT